MEMSGKRLPTFHVVEDNIPRAFWQALRLVWDHGAAMRTQYDRKNSAGEYIDPPSRDARVLIEIRDPLAQPRYPATSFCEIGAYVAEIFGLKNHLVAPLGLLTKMINGEPLTEEEQGIVNHWPYTYNQRIKAHPDANGHLTDQLRLAIKAVAKTPYTRRAMVTTAIPGLDPYLPEDIPCLRETQLRCTEDELGVWWLNVSTTWRSRDLFKGLPDNVVAITCWLQDIAQQISQESGHEVRVGSYADYSASLHVYGRDFGHVGGDQDRGLKSFFDTFPTADDYVARSMSSEMAVPGLVIPQLQGLLTPAKVQEWKLGEPQIALVKDLIHRFETGALI